MRDFRVCVVGAGPGGLAMARALKRLGIAYDQFERHSDVGGIWDQANPGSPMYDSAHMISSRTLSGFVGFPMPESFPDYPSHRQIVAYLRDFADRYGLRDRIRFNVEVTSAGRDGAGWLVRLSNGSEHRYDALVAATGLAWHPRLPDYPGQFSGETIHSSQYRSADLFKGKRVLVVGAGNSGVDIACDAARTADKAFISLRRGYHFVPKHVFGKPADVFAATSAWLPLRLQQWSFALLLRLLNGDVSRYGLKRPDHLPLSSHPIVNTVALNAMAHGDLTPKPDIARFDGSAVSFSDGSREEIDLIVFATGYVHKVPFLDPALLADDGLFLHTISRKDPTLAVLGYLEINAGAYPYFDHFADIIAHFYADLAAKRPRADQFRQLVEVGAYELGGSIAYVDSPRHKSYANTQAFKKVTARLRRAMGWPALRDDDMRPATIAARKRAA